MAGVKASAAVVAIFLTTVFTILKFIAFFITGSVAILTEAFHGFTDIATSLLVFMSVRKDEKSFNNKARAKPAGVTGWFSRRIMSLKKIYLPGFIKNISSDNRVSFIIAILLLGVSVIAIKNVINYTHPTIKYPVPAGLLFIFFSLCSYLVSSFEISTGKREKSAALHSDGLHSRADMFCSLIAGLSLVLYAAGMNVDRLAAFIIAIFILNTAIEIIVNSIMSIRKNVFEYNYRSYDLILFFLKRGTNVWFHNDIAKKTVSNTGRFKLATHIKRNPGYLLILLFFIYGSISCVFTVDPGYNAIIERLGVPFPEVYGPGLHFKYPFFADRIRTENTRIIRSLNIGNTTDKNTYALIWTVKHGDGEHFLSGDNNFFYPYIVINYRIKNLYDYLYRNKEPVQLLDSVAHHAINTIVIKKSFDEIVIKYRGKIEGEAVSRIQSEMDNLESGIEIVGADIKDIHPPILIAEAFEDVIAAIQDRQKMVNIAIGYKNNLVPRAMAEANKKVFMAEAYVSEKILHATGEAERFRMQVLAKHGFGDIVKNKMYLEANKKSLRGRNKIIIEKGLNMPEIWLSATKGDKSEAAKGVPFIKSITESKHYRKDE